MICAYTHTDNANTGLHLKSYSEKKKYTKNKVGVLANKQAGTNVKGQT